jgi:hypothetical protein
MRRKILGFIPVVAACAVWLAFPARAPAQDAAKPADQFVPPALAGQIITSTVEIQVPTSPKNFVALVRKQDKSTFKKNDEGKYIIHYVAFFNKATPVENLQVVVLDGKDALAVADVPVTKGSRTLSSNIEVENIENAGKKFVLQVFYPSGKKPVILAKKEIVLK